MSQDLSANNGPTQDRLAEFQEYEEGILEEIALCSDSDHKEKLIWELAFFYLRTARPEKATGPLRWIVETARKEQNKQGALQVLKQLSGSNKEAVSEPRDIVDLQHVLWEMANLYLGQGKRQSSTLCLLRLLDISSDQELRAKCFLLLGSEGEEAGLLDVAVRLYRQGIDCGPVEVDTRYFLNNNLGFCLNLSSEYQSAEHYCSEAINVLPNRHNAHKNLGLALKGQCRYLEAAESLIRATILCPADPRAYMELENLVAEYEDGEDGCPGIYDRIASLKILVDQAGRGSSIH